ncbi:stage V sporulation protein AA [Evansella cellulosilytica]|uniref:Stage V sporulation protein AA n=1 Tax=Evansella cellulosilytica (strain ATCC 21833 / DSM 2522 / FERM P-1141 / JCM 9156 / N-4) TaxID=649639 RepID=E6TYK8_EVAC2|nr:stage V sporulation protein AA [Evansella cellulosilytica]ADU30058.1 stage V sporulation protein AA [Evansella cellulosilytica DSM 2522]
MSKKVYIRLKSRYWGEKDQSVVIGDIAQVIVDGAGEQEIKNILVYKVDMSKKLYVIDSMFIVNKIQQLIKNVDVQVIGPTQTIVYSKQKNNFKQPVLLLFVWCLLFIGAGLAIMNFHEDVSMQEVHLKLYESITGETVEHPILLQIPYSIGLGLGMILFFNHVFRKRINEEPSPMEIEMFNYQENMDRYVSVYENEAWKERDG